MNATRSIPLPPKASRGRKPGPEFQAVADLLERQPIGACVLFDLTDFGGRYDNQRSLARRVSAAARHVGGNGWYAVRYLDEGSVGVWKISDGQGSGGANNAARVAR